MQTKTKSIIIGLIVYGVLALIQTRIDFYFNSDLYAKGLIFSETWYKPYSTLYFFLTVFNVLIASLFAKSYKLFIVLFFFAYSSGCDLIYFGIWNKGIFPLTNWVWMPNYSVFGFWNTETQIIYTMSLTLLGVLCAFIIGKLIKKLRA